MTTGAAIVIVTYNSVSSIGNCLNTLLATLRPCDEILVVDNNSQDETVELVHQFLEPAKGQIKLFPQSENTGFSRGCNIGIENSDKEYVILLNPDTEVIGNWIERITSHFKIYDKTGAVGGLSNRCIPSQSITTYFPDYLKYLEDANGLVETIESRFKQKSIPTQVLMGFCMALRRDLIDEFGGLDEDIFLGDDDIEISWRLRERGYMLRIALDVFVNHELQVSFSSLPEKEAEDIVRDGSDVLYRKMVDYYNPRKVPHPQIYFGLGWWNPRILETKPQQEVFDSDILPCKKEELMPVVQALVKNGEPEEAISMLEKSLNIIVNDYIGWFMLGSIYLAKEDLDEAEFALKNAWSYEIGSSGRASEKLKKLKEKREKLSSIPLHSA